MVEGERPAPSRAVVCSEGRGKLSLFMERNSESKFYRLIEPLVIIRIRPYRG